MIHKFTVKNKLKTILSLVDYRKKIILFETKDIHSCRYLLSLQLIESFSRKLFSRYDIKVQLNLYLKSQILLEIPTEKL